MTVIFRGSKIKGRKRFSVFLNHCGLTGIAAEIGTHRAAFAVRFLQSWKGKLLCCIDPWTGGQFDAGPVTQDERDEYYAKAMKALRPYEDRVKVMRTTSREASLQFDSNYFDFIYIDANHQYSSVWEDLTLWWPKLRSGGFLAGHDIVMPNAAFGGCEHWVQSAVMKFAEHNGLEVWLVTEGDSGRPWSYYMIKP